MIMCYLIKISLASRVASLFVALLFNCPFDLSDYKLLLIGLFWSYNSKIKI